jgi:hypothetical protein
MSRRKDLERYLRLKQANPDYQGFRGAQTALKKAEPLETVVCSACRRKRNVASDTLSADRDAYVCLSCQEAG